MFKRMKNWKKYLPIATTIIIVLFLGFGIDLKPSQTTPSSSVSVSPLYQDFHLLIPKLNLNAPVIADVDGTDKDAYFKALEGGVAHFKSTAKPGEGSNIFIFGHSSFYWYKPGDYKEIFKTLPDLTVGDEISLWYNSKEYRYKVTETKEVQPTEVDVLQGTKQEQVTLMTCVPPGTTLRRLIVIATPSQ